MKTEKIIAVAILVGLIFRFTHIPGSGILLVLSLTSLASIYLVGAFYFFCDKQLKKQSIALSIVSGILLCTIPIGILFKIQYWPGGGFINLIIGTTSAVVICIISFIKKSRSFDNLKGYYRNIFRRTLTLFLFGALFLFTPTATIIKLEYREDPELARLMILSYSNPNNEEYNKELTNYIMKKDSLNYFKDNNNYH